MTINRSQLVAGAFVVLLAIAALGIFALGPWNNVAAQAEPAAPAMTLPRVSADWPSGTKGPRSATAWNALTMLSSLKQRSPLR